MARPVFGTAALLLAAAAAAPLGAQEARPQTHTVKPGDTLWDLSRRYLNDPFLWPEIFRLNTMVVEDPHWIYPGEVLRLSASGEVVSVPTTDTPPPTVSDTAQVPSGLALGPTMADTGAGWQRYFAGRSGPALLGAVPPMQYRALRAGEFHSSGFLTEGRDLPYGKLLGRVTPSQVSAVSVRETATLYTDVLIEAPRGTSYETGDSLLVVRLGAPMGDLGRAVLPTGLVRIKDVADGRIVGSVIAVYGEIADGQRVLPAESFTPSGDARAVPVADGIQARVLGSATPQILKGPQDVVFLDKGRQAGVAAGDIFEVRRSETRRGDGGTEVPEVMAVLQVVRVGERSATARIINVMLPAFDAGAESRQIGRLPS
ncbi:MAG TPA: LysM peptidoglycan-binding domain-containing protein [Gemmatimonadales bacterium]|nr:LysM peptidoglycan-binding domain-containing protein [Gemmatimonadales bacterium]